MGTPALRDFLGFRAKPPAEVIPVERIPGGLVRGAVTEICGPAGSGRTSLLIAALREITARQEFCALVDSSDAFDPHSAAGAGVELERLLWVRCGGNAGHALKAADLLLAGGGFGLVALDLADLDPGALRRIPPASWYRLRRAIENTPTILLVLDREPVARPCASVALEMQRQEAVWSDRLFQGMRFEAVCRKRKAG
ncbi:MAG: hypothetical protein FJW37_02565 [Acidobacteria bacterium]|nr:hypothetical protein [Acidobacteriota bacterium]